jgi:hypothetical protein
MPWPFSKQNANLPTDNPPPFRVNLKTFLVKDQPWQACASWLRPEHVRQVGLPPEAVMAVIMRSNGPLDDSNVRGNAPFPDFLQNCMHTIIESSGTLPAVANRLKNGVLPIPDDRAWELWLDYPDRVQLPPWMIIGHIHVRDNGLVSDSYMRNPAYRGFAPGQGPMGISVMPEEFYPVLFENLQRIRIKGQAR